MSSNTAFRDMTFMRTTYALAVTAVLVAVAVSCHEEPLQYGDMDIAVELGTPVTLVLDEAQTRADVTTLSSFYVMCISGAPAKKYESSVWTASFSRDADGYYTGGKYWPGTTVTYSFYASNKIATISFDGTYVNAEPLTDVVVAKVASATYRQVVPLTFNHIYAKIGYCNVIPPSGFSVSGLSVRMTPDTGGRYYVCDGTWDYTTSSTLTLATTTGNTTSLENLIVPGTYSLSVNYTLTKDSYTESFNKSLSLTFEAGKKNNIEITLPEGDLSNPGGGVVIDPWEGDDDVKEEM